MAYQAQYRRPCVTPPRMNVTCALEARWETRQEKCLPLGGVDAAGASLAKAARWLLHSFRANRLIRETTLLACCVLAMIRHLAGPVVSPRRDVKLPSLTRSKRKGAIYYQGRGRHPARPAPPRILRRIKPHRPKKLSGSA